MAHATRVKGIKACQLGEGCCWDATARRLLWVDILDHAVFWRGPDNWVHRLDVKEPVGCVTPTSAENIVLAGLRSGIALIHLQTGEKHYLAQPEKDLPENRFNDGKCDRRGRFWGGTMPLGGSAPTGALYRLTPPGHCTRILDQITCSNGLAWSPDERTFYYVDTGCRTVDAFDFDPEQGEIRARRTAVDLRHESFYPDGMTIDDNGNLWVALWNGWGVGCFDPATGRELDLIEVPAAQVTCCCFGGDDGKDLYITTATTGVSESDLQGPQFQAGRIFLARPGVSGSSAQPFALESDPFAGQ